MRFNGRAGSLREGAEGAREFGVRAARVAGLHGLYGGAQRGAVVRRVAHHAHLRAEGQHLRAVRAAHPRDLFLGQRLRAREPVALAHAEGIVEGEDEQACGRRPRAPRRD